MPESFEAFFSFNSKDQDVAFALAALLKERGVPVWLSHEQLVAGSQFPREIEHVLQTVPASAILMGGSGIGEWQKTELDACINESVRRRMRLIPVLLPGAPADLEIPAFLAVFTYVDLRRGIEEAGLRDLIHGIRGRRSQWDALETTQILMKEAVSAQAEPQRDRWLDAWGMAAVKSRLHAASEVLAHMAVDHAMRAAAEYLEDMLTLLVPLAVDLRWKRGYASGLERLLAGAATRRRLSQLSLAEVSPRCVVREGVLSAERQEEGRVLIRLQGQPAVVVSSLDEAATETVLTSVNGYGRLGVPSASNLPLLARIGEVPLRESTASNEMTAVLSRNREALIPLLARLGMPGEDWLLAGDEEEISPPGDLLLTEFPPAESRTPFPVRESGREEEMLEEIYTAEGEAQAPVRRRRVVNNQLRELLQSDAARLLLGDIVDKDPEEALKLLEKLIPRRLG